MIKKTIQEKLKARLSKLEKINVKHRVEGYRQTESARGLLSAARSRHDLAIRKSHKVLELLGDTIGVTESWIIVVPSRTWRGGKYRVYSANGRDICMIEKYGIADLRESGDAISYMKDNVPLNVKVFRQ